MRRAIGLLLIGGCDPGAIVLAPPWSADQTAVVVAVDVHGRAADPSIHQPKEALRLEVGADDTVYARAFSPTHPVATCGWTVDPDAAGADPDGAWTYAPGMKDWSVETQPYADLGIAADCSTTIARCEDVIVERVAPPGAVEDKIHRIVAVDEDEVFYAHQFGVNLVRSGRIVFSYTTDSEVRRVDFDGTELWFQTMDDIITFDREGVVTSTRPRSVVHLSAALDGTVLGFWENNLVDLAGGAAPDAPGAEIEMIAVAARDRFVVASPGAFFLHDGAGWSVEHDRTDPGKTLDEMWPSPHGFVAFGRPINTIWRTIDDPTWRTVQTPFMATRVRHGVVSKEGPVLVGDAGLVQIESEPPCIVDVGIRSVLEAVDVAAGVVWAGGEGDEDGRLTLLRIMREP